MHRAASVQTPGAIELVNRSDLLCHGPLPGNSQPIGQATPGLDATRIERKIERMFEMTDGARLPAPADPVASSASKLWAERANPISWHSHTWLGDWLTDDRVTWRTVDGRWMAQLQQSANRRHTFLALWRDGDAYVGFQDDAGWHPATARRRKCQPYRVLRTLPMPLPLVG
jgi:hypothetical protein